MKIRCLTTIDKPHIMAIEKQSFSSPWTWQDFIQFLNNKNAVGKVATTNSGRILGYMIYELNEDSVRVVNIAVHGDLRQRGFGSLMLEHLRLCLNGKRKRLLAEIWEYDLTAQLFFKKNNFQAYSIMRGYFEDGTDAYAFKFSVCEEDAFWLSPYSTRICL